MHAAFAEVVGAFCAEIAEIVAEIKEQANAVNAD
jgi:hypothetical protein